MPQPPNILFLFPDQWRHDWTGLNPDLDIRTPHLAALAARGATFTDTACPSPLCAPSRACLALGLEYDRCPVKVNQHDLPLNVPTLYSRLRDAGYHTMGCGKFDLHKDTYRWGLDGRTDLDEWGFADGIDNEGKIDAFLSDKKGMRGPYMHWLDEHGLRQAHWDDHQARGEDPARATPLPEEAYCDNWICQNGLDLLDRAPAGKPWFLQVNFTGPHSPFDVTERMWRSVRDRELPLPVHAAEKPDPHALELRRNYVAMLENLDRLVGLLLARLEQRGELANTLVVFASDHGEMLGDHGLYGKCHWRHASLDVPLIAAGPGVAAGSVCSAPTELLDLSATFLETAGVPVPGDWDSRSLWPVLRGEADAARETITAGLTWSDRHQWRVVADRQWKLVRDNGQLHLYDRQADPEEVRDLAADLPDVVERLAAHLPA